MRTQSRNRQALILFGLTLAVIAALRTSGVSATKGAIPKIHIAAALRWTTPERSVFMAVTRAGLRLVMVGEHGIVLLSDDGGRSFRQAKSVPVQSTLTAV